MRRHTSTRTILTAALLAAAAFAATLSGCDSSSDGGGGSEAEFNAVGEWKGNYTIPGSSSNHTFSAEISQDGGRITGEISISLIDLSGTEITGTVEGRTLTFGDIGKVITLKGTAAEDDTAKGTYVLEYNGETIKGNWSATCYRIPTLEKTISLPEGAGGTYSGLAWDGEAFWLANGQILHRVSTGGELLDTHMYNMDEFPLHDFTCIAWDGESLWVTEDGIELDWALAQLSSIDPSTGSISATIPAPPDGSSSGIAGPIGIGLAWDGSSLWCYKYIDYDAQTIYRIDRSDGSVQDSIPAPKDSDGMSVWAGGIGAVGSMLCISDRECLYMIRTSDGKVMKRIIYDPLGEGEYYSSPGGVAWDGELLWVRDTGTDELYGFSLP